MQTTIVNALKSINVKYSDIFYTNGNLCNTVTIRNIRKNGKLDPAEQINVESVVSNYLIQKDLNLPFSIQWANNDCCEEYTTLILFFRK